MAHAHEFRGDERALRAAFERPLLRRLRTAAGRAWALAVLRGEQRQPAAVAVGFPLEAAAAVAELRIPADLADAETSPAGALQRYAEEVAAAAEAACAQARRLKCGDAALFEALSRPPRATPAPRPLPELPGMREAAAEAGGPLVLREDGAFADAPSARGAHVLPAGGGLVTSARLESLSAQARVRARRGPEIDCPSERAEWRRRARAAAAAARLLRDFERRCAQLELAAAAARMPAAELSPFWRELAAAAGLCAAEPSLPLPLPRRFFLVDSAAALADAAEAGDAPASALRLELRFSGPRARRLLLGAARLAGFARVEEAAV